MHDDTSLLEPVLEPVARICGSSVVRRRPIGAEPQPDGGVHFRLWAAKCREVRLEIEGLPPVFLDPEGQGYFSAMVEAAAPGMRYCFRVDHTDKRLPDPASRFQPDGPHGPSQIVDPGRFRWSDAAWRGPIRDTAVIYETHIGTFTAEGTWEAATRELPRLAEIGITCLEVMPVAEFPGRFGWGYDGVALFAPTRLYGEPDDFRAFVDRAHGLGLAVILDVVYNHLGPDGNYLNCFSDDYFTDRYKNEWGQAINFDGPDAEPVREFFLANAAFWVDEYHLDGLRLDATQQIYDASPHHVLGDIVSAVRRAARGRGTLVVGENETQVSRLVRPAEQDGYGLDALWNDDFHHSAVVALTGRREAYYSDYLGGAREFVAAAKHGFLYQGQRYVWQDQPRGKPSLDIPPGAFVVFLENHDQVANSADGRRLHQLTSPGRWRAMTAYTLLMPGTPMLFQGQEFASSRPFLYFADHDPELACAVRQGRREFLSQFPSIDNPESTARLADPADAETFRRCILDAGERDRNEAAVALHRDLLRLRRDDPVFRRRPLRFDGATIGEAAWLLRFFGDQDDRVLLVNFGRDMTLAPLPEPLLAPLDGQGWRVLWSSESPVYGGRGVAPLYQPQDLHLPGEAALVLAPGPAPQRRSKAATCEGGEG